MTRWLAGQGVTRVAMEATGIYTMPVYHALLEPGSFEQVLVCNAAHVKNVPGRKAGAVDAAWLAGLLECGLLRGSFIPPAEIKTVRDVVRYRRKLVQLRPAETQRLGGVAQDAGITLGSVASSIGTVSGLAMIRALIDAERRGQPLADLARGVMRSKIADPSRAVEGRFDDHHALMCQLHLDHVAHLNEREPGLLGRALPGQPRIRGQAQARQAPQGRQHLQPLATGTPCADLGFDLLRPPHRPGQRSTPAHRQARSPRPQGHPGTRRLNHQTRLLRVLPPAQPRSVSYQEAG